MTEKTISALELKQNVGPFIPENTEALTQYLYAHDIIYVVIDEYLKVSCNNFLHNLETYNRLTHE